MSRPERVQRRGPPGQLVRTAGCGRRVEAGAERSGGPARCRVTGQEGFGDGAVVSTATVWAHLASFGVTAPGSVTHGATTGRGQAPVELDRPGGRACGSPSGP